MLKLQGREAGPPLILLSHLDVVGANAEEWKYPPFEGTIAEGYLWGRGTIDTKQLTAMELMAMLMLAKQKFVPERDIYLIATADEESGAFTDSNRCWRATESCFETRTSLAKEADFRFSLTAKPSIYAK